MSEWRNGPDAAELSAAEQVSPEAVRSYLTSAGWQRQEPANRAAIWTLADADDEFEVLLPVDRQLRDFPIRMFDLLRTLAIIEDRAVSSIMNDLASTDTDTMTFRLLPDGPPGTVGLFSGVDAVAGIRELVLATAYASVLGRPLLVQGRRPGPVREFAQQVRLGTPQSGSWMISAQMRLPEPGVEPADDGRPQVRQVSLQLHRAVRATLMAAGEALRDREHRRDLGPFLRRASDGVSANVCEALAKLGRDESPFEVRFAWALRSPVQVGAGRFRFDRAAIALLRETGERLRNTLPEGRVVVRGTVTKLRREGGTTGDVVVTGTVESQHGAAEHKVTARLQPQLYDIAVEAHRQRRPVRLDGAINLGRMDIVYRIEIDET